MPASADTSRKCMAEVAELFGEEELCALGRELAWGEGFEDSAGLETAWPEQVADNATARIRPETRRIKTLF